MYKYILHICLHPGVEHSSTRGRHLRRSDGTQTEDLLRPSKLGPGVLKLGTRARRVSSKLFYAPLPSEFFPFTLLYHVRLHVVSVSCVCLS